ncbi:hypothetical protein DWZ21_29515 [Hungatella hathewayi]|nr:hypothetical protein DWZ21_29515 [Hungatella hathewayi]
MIFEGHEVEVFELNGRVLFNPKHVAECLEIADVNSSVRNFNKKQLVKVRNSDVHNLHIRKFNNAGENFLTESGVYKLVFKSHKPNAEAFTDWIADEVLPTLRKTGSYQMPKQEKQADRIRIMDMNARTRMANMYLKLSQVDTLSPTYKTVLVSKASEVLAGEELIPLPKMEKKSYSAGEIGQIFGISANRVGRIANIHNLKTDQYGEYRRDKSQYSVKEVDTWVYFDTVIPVLSRILLREGKCAGNDIAPMLRRYIATLTYEELCDFEIRLSDDDSPAIQDILSDLRKIKAEKARTA